MNEVMNFTVYPCIGGDDIYETHKSVTYMLCALVLRLFARPMMERSMVSNVRAGDVTIPRLQSSLQRVEKDGRTSLSFDDLTI